MCQVKDIKEEPARGEGGERSSRNKNKVMNQPGLTDISPEEIFCTCRSVGRISFPTERPENQESLTGREIQNQVRDVLVLEREENGKAGRVESPEELGGLIERVGLGPVAWTGFCLGLFLSSNVVLIVGTAIIPAVLIGAGKAISYFEIRFNRLVSEEPNQEQ
jgi:hypothetical protein